VEDRQLAALQLAKKYWMEARNADTKHKLQLAGELHAFELFSLNQLAKIVRINTKYVAAAFKSNAKGGRFEPEALSCLIQMRKCVVDGTRVQPSLLRLTLEGGVSFSCAVTLTGISYSSYYKEIPRQFRREEVAESERKQREDG
jgi:hypothetical protein